MNEPKQGLIRGLSVRFCPRPHVLDIIQTAWPCCLSGKISNLLVTCFTELAFHCHDIRMLCLDSCAETLHALFEEMRKCLLSPPGWWKWLCEAPR